MSTNRPRDAASDPLIRLRAGDAEVAIDPGHGGRLASVRITDRELLVGQPEGADTSIRWGSFLMAPWAGRLAGGRLQWRGRLHQLRRNHGSHAIHGLVFDSPWTVDRVTESAARLSIDLGAVGWPFRGRVRQEVALGPDHLGFEATIEAEQAMPAALGWHPWFSRRSSDPSVRVDADQVLVTSGMIPTGAHRLVAGRLDLRHGPRLGDRRLDHVYVGAISPAAITWPDLTLALEFGEEIRAVVVHTPPTGFCVEPQTAGPGAFDRALDAGESLTVGLRWRWSSTPPGSSSPSPGP